MFCVSWFKYHVQGAEVGVSIESLCACSPKSLPSLGEPKGEIAEHKMALLGVG